jgi:outer membrane receptor protein involved in Fe transport
LAATCLFAGAAIAPLAAQAQSTQPPASGAPPSSQDDGRPAHKAGHGDMPEVVVTASRTDLIGKATTASEGSVTKEELQLRPAYRVGQLLETVPGLVVTVHSGEGKAYQYLARGFNLDHGTDIANFIDDIPINRPTNAHGQGYSDLNFVIPQVLDGLDYTKGTYYPSVGDFGDVASEHMRIADAIPNQISASGDTFGDYEGYVGGTHTFANGDHLMAAVDISKVDGPFDPGNDFRKYAAIARYSQGTAANGDDLTVMYYKGDGDFITDQPVRAMQEGVIGRYGTLDPSDGNSSERLSVSGHYAWERGDWSFTSSAYYVRSRQTLWNNFTHFLEDTVNGDQEQQDESRNLAGGQAAVKLKSSFAGIDTQTTVGVQGRYDDLYVDRRHTRDRVDLDYCELLNPDGTASEISVGLPDCSASRVQLGDVGLYVDSNTRWTSWLRTDLGLRYEYYAGQDRSLLPGTVFSTTPFNKAVDLLQPKADIVLGPWWNTEFYLSAGRGFHSDDLRGVSGTVPLEGLGGTGRSPLLVKADSAEVGVRTNIIPKVHVQVAVFNIRLDSEVIYDQDEGIDQPGPTSDRYGVEISAEYKPFYWLELNSDLAFSHAQFINTSPADLSNNFGEDGNHIPLAPSFIGSIGAIVDNLGPWYGGIQVRALGPYPLVSDNTEKDDGYTETNVDVGYKITKSLKAQVAIYNLFDVRANSAAFYYTTDIHDGLGPTSDHQVHPLEPIAARFTMTATF